MSVVGTVRIVVFLFWPRTKVEIEFTLVLDMCSNNSHCFYSDGGVDTIVSFAYCSS